MNHKQKAKIKEILDDIKYRRNIEQYQKWAKHPNKTVRLAIAEAGDAISITIHDKDPEVRQKTVEYRDLVQYDLVRTVIDGMTSIPNDAMLAYKKGMNQFIHDTNQKWTTAYIDAKIAAANYKPTQIEMTMTNEQLYLSRSPLWCYDLSFRDTFYLVNFLNGETDYDKICRKFKLVLE